MAILGISAAILLAAVLAHEVVARLNWRKRMAAMRARTRVAVASAQWPDLLDDVVREAGKSAGFVILN